MFASPKMRQIQQVIYILLYLQFFVHNVFTFDSNISSKENTIDTNDIMLTNEWECDFNDNCTAKDSMCKDNLCQCKPGFILNADMTACVKVATRLYDSCEDTVQCSAYLLSGAKCVKNVCICGPGYYYLHGRCNRYVNLFKKCKQNIDCYVNADFEASTCNEVKGICKCSPGFYRREYRTCRREGKAVGDECTIDIDCTFDNATCSEFVCAEIPETDETVKLSSSVILTKGILDKKTRVDNNCTTNEDCREVRNAICDPTGICRCDRAHFPSNTDTECIPELGESCQDDDISYIEKSICREGRWSCTNGTVASKDNRKCLSATREYMGNCDLDEQCYIFGPDALCNNNKCICNENVSHYVKSELFCWKNTGLNEYCKQDQDCYVKDFKGNLICNNTCNCPNGTRLSKDKMACIGPTEVGGFCEKNIDCVTPQSACVKKVCTCKKNYYESEKRCLAGIGADCTGYDDCGLENAMCIAKICSCKPNYVSAAINSCIPVSLFGEPCLLDIQCSAVTIDAICAVDNKNTEYSTTELTTESTTIAEIKTCICSKKDYYKFGRCFKIRFLDETCANLGECYGNNEKIVCRNGKCECIWGYMKSDNNVCVKHPQASKFFLDGTDSATNVVAMRFLLIVSFIFSSKLF